MKNSADLGGCYPPWPSASVDNTLLDLQDSSYPTQSHSIIVKYSAELLHHVALCGWLVPGLETAVAVMSSKSSRNRKLKLWEILLQRSRLQSRKYFYSKDTSIHLKHRWQRNRLLTHEFVSKLQHVCILNAASGQESCPHLLLLKPRLISHTK